MIGLTAEHQRLFFSRVAVPKPLLLHPWLLWKLGANRLSHEGWAGEPSSVWLGVYAQGLPSPAVLDGGLEPVSESAVLASFPAAA